MSSLRFVSGRGTTFIIDGPEVEIQRENVPMARVPFLDLLEFAERHPLVPSSVNLLYQAQQEARTELPSGREVEDKSGQETKPPQERLEGFEMNGDELMFELRGPGGEAWLLYLDGRFEGFPQGTIILNHALPTVNRLLGEMLRPVQGAASQKP